MKGGIFSTSIGHKLIMSITGLFLMMFLLVHLSMNLTLMMNDITWLGTTWGPGELFNTGAHFMISNPIIRLVEPLLAIGFIFHIIYATIVTLLNRKRRPIGYAVSNKNYLSTWSSKNMYILGATILIFLVIHLMQFFYDIRFTEMPTTEVKGVEMEDTFAIVAGLFTKPGAWGYIYSCLYMLGGVALGLHLSHGFWSAFQTVGWNNMKWVQRIKVISIVFGVLVGGGFAVIPLYFLLIY